MITLKQFKNDSNIQSDLINGVVKQFGDYEYFTQCASDICQYGANSGFAGFTYYVDTVKFAKKYKVQITGLLRDFANDFGESFATTLCGFQCFKGYDSDDILDGFYNPKSEYKTVVYNALSWFALEEVARSYCDLTEQ